MEEDKPAEAPAQKTPFSWGRVIKIVSFVVLAGAAFGGGYFLAGYRPVKVAFASLILDRHENYLLCEQLPFLDAVNDEMAKHADVITKMRNLGATSITTEKISCPSGLGFYFVKGDMVVAYGSRQQREAIEHLIGDNFFGIAYRGYEK